MVGKEMSPYNSESLMIKALGILMEHLQEAIKEIKELFAMWTPIEYKGNLVGRVFEAEDRVEFIPVESLRIKADDRAVGWLQKNVLEKAKEKHGWNYQLMTDKNGLLDRIVVYGAKTSDVKDLLNPIGWTFWTVSERPSPSGGGGK